MPSESRKSKMWAKKQDAINTKCHKDGKRGQHDREASRTSGKSSWMRRHSCWDLNGDKKLLYGPGRREARRYKAHEVCLRTRQVSLLVQAALTKIEWTFLSPSSGSWKSHMQCLGRACLLYSGCISQRKSKDWEWGILSRLGRDEY